jgi:hypothetical protein
MDAPQFPVLNFQDFIADDGEKLTTDSLKDTLIYSQTTGSS